jgi:hypothetical protein
VAFRSATRRVRLQVVDPQTVAVRVVPLSTMV